MQNAAPLRKSFFVKYHERKFRIRFAFIEQDYLLNNVKNFSFWLSISVPNSSTELTKEPTIYDFIFLTALYFPKNDNKHPVEMRN